MDMIVIDTVYASTIEVGDSIRFIVDGEDFGIQEVKSVEDNGTDDWSFVTIISENGEEVNIDADMLIDLYGYEK